MEIKKYPDGTSYVTTKYETIKNCQVKINSYEDLWHLGQYLDVCNHNGHKPVITIPNLLDAQADRRFASNESSGLSLVCKFLNSFNAKYRIFHPHNPEVVEALMDNVEIIDNSGFIRPVLEYIRSYNFTLNKNAELEKDLILMSSDAGGFKPLIKLCDKLQWIGETYSANKARIWGEDSGTQLIQLVDVQDFGGKDILIVDDICVYGGTFKGLAKLLRGRNVGKLYLAVSHMTIQYHKDSELFDLFDTVFTTNSKFDEYWVPDNEGHVKPFNLEIIKLFN